MYDASLYAIMGGFFFIFLIIFIGLYVVAALALQAMAKKLDIENSWLAWIPIANAYLMGKVAGDEVTVFEKKIPKLSMVMLIVTIASAVLSSAPLIGPLASLASLVLAIIVTYKIYRIFAGSNAVLYTVISFVIFVTAPFLLLMASKNEPNMTIFNEGKDGGYTGYTGYTPAQPAAPVTQYIEDPTPATPVEPAVETPAEPVVDAVPEPAAEAADAPAADNTADNGDDE